MLIQVAVGEVGGAEKAKGRAKAMAGMLGGTGFKSNTEAKATGKRFQEEGPERTLAPGHRVGSLVASEGRGWEGSHTIRISIILEEFSS